MGILDNYLQSKDSEDDGTTLDPATARRKRADLERQIVITDSDLRKILREKQEFEMEQRRLRKHEERIRVERDTLDKKLKKMENDQMLLEDEIKVLKKKLKILQ